MRCVTIHPMLLLCLWSFTIGSVSLIGSASLAPARAGVLYVDPAAPGPEHDGATWSTAHLKIGDALLEARTGDAIHVAAGQYGEALSLKEGVSLYGGYPGAPNGPENPRDPRAYPSVLLGQAGTNSVVTVPIGVSPATVFDGFEFRTEATYGLYCTDASPVISGNAFYYGSTGVNCGAGGAPRVLNNTFTACATAVNAIGSSPLVAGNLIVASSTGVRISGGATTLVNNTVVWCSRGVSLTNSTGTLANNILALNETGLRSDRGTVAIRNTIVSGNAVDYDGLDDPTGQDGNMRQDPGFVNSDEDDYRLVAGSACIGAGDNAAVVTERDLDGNPRIQGSRVDLGAYEAAAPSVPDPGLALRIAGGLRAATPEDMPRVDLESEPPSGGIVDLLDALRLARQPRS